MSICCSRGWPNLLRPSTSRSNRAFTSVECEQPTRRSAWKFWTAPRDSRSRPTKLTSSSPVRCSKNALAKLLRERLDDHQFVAAIVHDLYGDLLVFAGFERR